MSIDIAGRIASLIEETKRIEAESERVYLELGRLFPKLAAEMNLSADNAERSLRGFGELAAEGRSSMDVAAMRRFAEESGAYFRGLHEADTAFLATANEGIKRLSSLESVIGQVRSDSEEMEIISLNAMTVALKSGSEGKAFSVITDELKRLSGRTIALTEDVTDRGRALLDSFGKLSASLGELDSFQAGFFSQLAQTLSGGYSSIERSVDEAQRFFGGLLAKARAAREPVTRVMQEIQNQDIVRQSLQHVGISLGEALSGEAGSREGLAFAGAAAELSESLVAEIIAKLDGSIGAFAADMSTVREIVSVCERERSDFLVGSDSAAQAVDMGRFAEGSARYLSLKRSAIAASKRLADQVKGLDESFKTLAALLSRFQTIVVASRIEVARTRALVGVATTVQGMIQLTAKIESDVSGAMGTTKNFIRAASSAIVLYADSEGDERLSSTLRRVEGDLVSLDAARVAVRKAAEGFSLYTADFILLAREASGLLDQLRSLSASLGKARADLAALRDDARAGLEPGSEGVETERLRAMVERFTIFTHKKTAGEIGRFAVEAGAEAGEVTLF